MGYVGSAEARLLVYRFAISPQRNLKAALNSERNSSKCRPDSRLGELLFEIYARSPGIRELMKPPGSNLKSSYSARIDPLPTQMSPEPASVSYEFLQIMWLG